MLSESSIDDDETVELTEHERGLAHGPTAFVAAIVAAPSEIMLPFVPICMPIVIDVVG